MNEKNSYISVVDLEMAYGNFVIQKDLNFTIRKGEVFIIMGGSGCGKSTLLKHLIGLMEPSRGKVLYNGVSFWDCESEERDLIMRRSGILYQSGALWSSMTLEENVSLPLMEYSDLSQSDIKDLVSIKLSLLGLRGYEDFYPSDVSGGMRKRAAFARAIALDPEVLFFDEPSAGLDPVNARLMDDLILEMRDSLGATIIVVTHELPSIFAIGDDSVYLDADTKTMTATGNPNQLLKESSDPKVLKFLTRGESNKKKPESVR